MFRVNFLKKKSIDEPVPHQTKKSVKIHINQITAKAAGLLKSFANLKRFGMTEQILLSCYKTYVMPIVMYGYPVWHPSLTEKDRSQLETIQTRACKIILGSNYKNYEESLSELRLPSLDEMRHETLMKFGADILKSPTHRDILPQFTSVTHTHKTRVATFKEGKELLECPPTHSTTRFLNSFVPYYVKHYNDNIREVIAHHVCSVCCVFLRFSIIFFLMIPMLLHYNKGKE